MKIKDGSLAYLFEHDEPESDAEMEIIASFLQDLRDWGDIWGEIETGDRIRTQFNLTKRIEELESIGYLVFAKAETGSFPIANKSQSCQVSVVMIARKTNTAITPAGDLATMIRFSGML